MRFVLTNDDGIDARGLALLAEQVAERGQVSVVAPETEQSGVGHRVSVDARAPLHCQSRDVARFSVSGTPADCVRVALRGLGLEADWVLSGLNAGGNLGIDLMMSGTVAAAREAAALGLPAIALSQVLSRAHPPDGARVRRNLARVLDELLARPPAPGSFYNVNLPFAPEDDEPEIVHCLPDPSPHDVRYRREGDHFHYAGVFLDRPRREGHDVAVAFSGKIAVSTLALF